MVHSMLFLLLPSTCCQNSSSIFCRGCAWWLGTPGAASPVPRLLAAGVFEQAGRKLIHLPLRFVLGNSITFLNLANQLLALPLDHFHVAIRQLAPLLTNFSGILFP